MALLIRRIGLIKHSRFSQTFTFILDKKGHSQTEKYPKAFGTTRSSVRQI